MELTPEPRVLVIDDLRVFDDYPNATYARTRKEGERQIFSTPGVWDIVFLDHDLGEQGKEGPHDFGDIRPLVSEIVSFTNDNGLLPIRQFYVCSSNPPGRDWIIATLKPWYPVEFFQPKHHDLWG